VPFYGNKAFSEATADWNITDCSSTTDNGDLLANCLISMFSSTTTAAAGATADSIVGATVKDSAAIAGKHCTQCAAGYGPRIDATSTCVACPANGVICTHGAAVKVYACSISGTAGGTAAVLSNAPASFEAATCGA
jgi:hypothetical protein